MKIQKKYWFLPMLTAVMLTVSCSDVSTKQKELGQNLEGTLLEGLGRTVGVADVKIVESILDTLNRPQAWTSVYGSEIVVAPTVSYFNSVVGQWCRRALIRVDGVHETVLEACKGQQGWVAVNKQQIAPVATVTPAERQTNLSSTIGRSRAVVNKDKNLLIKKSVPTKALTVPAASVSIAAKPVIESKVKSVPVKSEAQLQKVETDKENNPMVKKLAVVKSAKLANENKVKPAPVKSEPEAQKNKTYTIQIIAATNSERVTQFYNQYKNTAPLRTFYKMQKGKKVFVVSYGAYASENEAVQALKQLPAAFKKNTPWILHGREVPEEKPSKHHKAKK